MLKDGSEVQLTTPGVIVASYVEEGVTMYVVKTNISPGLMGWAVTTEDYLIDMNDMLEDMRKEAEKDKQ